MDQLYFAALDITHYTCMLVLTNGIQHSCSDLIESNVILGHEVVSWPNSSGSASPPTAPPSIRPPN